MKLFKSPENGFTLVEIVVILPIMMLAITIIGALLITLFSKISQNNSQVELQLNSQLALFTARDDLFYATRFAGKPQPDTTDSYEPVGGWNAVRDNALVVYEASYTKNRQAEDRRLIYKKDTPLPCDDENIIQNQYSTNTLIYFLKDATLYKRTLVPNQTSNCSSTFRQQTCPAGAATATCPADTVVAENVKTFNITYYGRDSGDGEFSQTRLEADPSLFIQVSRADIELTLERIVGAEPIQAKAKINIKKIE